MSRPDNSKIPPPNAPAEGPRAPMVVSPEEAGQKLLQFLQRRLSREVPGSALLRIIRTGEVRVDGGRKKPFFRLSAGQEVRVPPLTRVTPPANAASVGTPPGGTLPIDLSANQFANPIGSPADSPAATPGLDLLFESPGYVAVRKPAGLCSHAGTRHKDSVADRLKALYAHAPFLPVLTHRLDKDTSGILLAAKSYAELRRLNDLFASRGVVKTYLTWVDGAWPGKGPEIMEDQLDRLDLAQGQADRKKVLAASSDEGKTARAEVRPLVRKRQATLLLVRLFTGRTHQIRVQLSLRGHAVISDAVYGRKVRGTPMLLHALCLRLPERALFAPPDWTGPFALPDSLVEKLRVLLTLEPEATGSKGNE
jgi:23S rRNA pseudouridine955/2504/2580 synthase